MATPTATAVEIILLAQAFLLGLIVLQLQIYHLDRLRDRLNALRDSALSIDADEWDDKKARLLDRQAHSVGHDLAAAFKHKVPRGIWPQVIFLAVSAVLLIVLMIAEVQARDLPPLANPFRSAKHAAGYVILAVQVLLIVVEWTFVVTTKRHIRACVDDTIATSGLDASVRFLLVNGLVGTDPGFYAVDEVFTTLPVPRAPLQYRAKVDVRRALACAEVALAAASRSHGPENEQTARAAIVLSSCMVDSGRPKDGLASMEELIARRESALAHDVRAEATAQMIECLARSGLADRGLLRADQEIACFSETLDKAHPSMLKLMTAKGTCLWFLREPEGLELYAEILRRWEATRRECPERFAAQAHYANALALWAEPVQARTELERSIKDLSESLTDDHPTVLMMRFNVAYCLRDQDSEKALIIDEEVAAAQRRVLGDDHPHALNTMRSIAFDMTAIGGRDQEALEIDEFVLARRRKILGYNHPDTLISEQDVQVDRRRLAEALASAGAEAG